MWSFGPERSDPVGVALDAQGPELVLGAVDPVLHDVRGVEARAEDRQADDHDGGGLPTELEYRGSPERPSAASPVEEGLQGLDVERPDGGGAAEGDLLEGFDGAGIDADEYTPFSGLARGAGSGCGTRARWPGGAVGGARP